MDTTSLDEQVEALEHADPAEAVEPAERLAEELEERLDREADAAPTP
jgi:hypothetical protein